MQRRIAQLAAGLTAASVRWRGSVVAGGAAVTLALAAAALRAPSEVGYAAYFGPHSPEVARLERFLAEFESGVHMLVAVGCRETTRCERMTEPWALALLGRLHVALDAAPNLRRTHSLLDAAIVTGPLETRTLATRSRDGFVLDPDWRARLEAARAQPRVRGALLAPDERSAGIVVELRSIESAAMRESVHAVLATLPAFEQQLGAEIHVAGDPLWTVLSADTLERDARVLTILMFAVMGALLLALLRDPGLALLPVLAVAAVAAFVDGVAALAGLPMTSLRSALPPLLVVIAVAASIHLLAAVARGPRGDPARTLPAAAREVGPGCFWAAATTAGGFASFLASDLASFRHFGMLAALGAAVAFLVTFTLLPALLAMHLSRASQNVHRGSLPFEVVRGLREGIGRHPRFVLAVCLGGFASLASGIPRLHYATDFGFGERSFVVRSLRAIEANLRRPMTTEVVVTLPPGAAVHEPGALRLLDSIEMLFEAEPSTGSVWSFLDLLDEAQRLDRGRPAGSLEERIAAARRHVALLAVSGASHAWWREAVAEGDRERTRLSVDRSWLDDDEQPAYVARVRAGLAALEAGAPAGTRIELEGGLVLADQFVTQLRETQQRSFAGAFALVAATLALLLRGHGALVPWSIAANLLPVGALVGLMGWAGIGIDPANTMVGAILLATGVDDTVHLSLRYAAARSAGDGAQGALDRALRTAGEPVLVTSIVLGVGFSVLLFSEWGGLVGFGLLASLGVALLLAGDLVMLPAALLSSAARRGA